MDLVPVVGSKETGIVIKYQRSREWKGEIESSLNSVVDEGSQQF